MAKKYYRSSCTSYQWLYYTVLEGFFWLFFILENNIFGNTCIPVLVIVNVTISG